ncbi:MAG: hypothetical protein SVR81_03400 [Chloroflexota bacterium]|nr:hypothetical protein [Chloroflexota bacterium]
MKKSKVGVLLPIIGGILLIAAGVILLLDNMNIIAPDWNVLVGPMFAIGGLVFLLVYILNTDEWWALIPGCVLIAIGIIIFMGERGVAEQLTGGVFLGLLALSFLLVYAFHRENWWAIIPGGVLLTLAVVAVLPESDWTGSLFFLGMAATFGLLYVLPNPEGKLKWALYPAGALLVLGLMAALGVSNLINLVWPLALLIAGGVIIFRVLRNK